MLSPLLSWTFWMNIRCSTRSIFVWESCSPNPAIKQIIFLRANVIKRNEFTFLDMPPLRKTMLSLIPKHALTTKGRSLPRNSSSKGSGFKASNHGFQIDLAEPPHPKKNSEISEHWLRAGALYFLLAFLPSGPRWQLGNGHPQGR